MGVDVFAADRVVRERLDVVCPPGSSGMLMDDQARSMFAGLDVDGPLMLAWIVAVATLACQEYRTACEIAEAQGQPQDREELLVQPAMLRALIVGLLVGRGE